MDFVTKDGRTYVKPKEILEAEVIVVVVIVMEDQVVVQEVEEMEGTALLQMAQMAFLAEMAAEAVTIMVVLDPMGFPVQVEMVVVQVLVEMLVLVGMVQTVQMVAVQHVVELQVPMAQMRLLGLFHPTTLCQEMVKMVSQEQLAQVVAVVGLHCLLLPPP